jgi:hypothetical protein
MKCLVCSQRKGKRSCPAKGELICAQCCGEKRVLEIDCPEECQYLLAGRKKDVEYFGARYLQPSDPVRIEQQRRVFGELFEAYSRFEFALAESRHSMSDLNDNDAAEALKLVMASLRTEQSGILYEQTADDLKVESVRRNLREHAVRLQNPSEEGGRRYRIGEILDCLDFIQGLLAKHLTAGSLSSGYIDFLARLMPRRHRLSAPGSSIIIPGRG